MLDSEHHESHTKKPQLNSICKSILILSILYNILISQTHLISQSESDGNMIHQPRRAS